LGAANTYTGTTVVSGGTLAVDASIGGSINSASSLTLGGGTFKLVGASGGTTQTFAGLTLTAGTNSTLVVDPNNGAGATIALGALTSRGAAATLQIDLSSANTGTRAVTTTAADGVLGYALVTDASGTGLANVSSGSITRLTALTALADNSNSATGDFTTAGISGAFAWQNGLTTRSIDSLTVDTSSGAQTVNLGPSTNILTLTSGAILFTGTNNGTLAGGQIGAANSEIIVHQLGSGTFTIAGLLGSGTSSLLKTGTGTLVLSGLNSFSGATTINAGTLQAGAPASAFGSSSAVSIASGATLALAGYTERIGSLAGAGTVNLTNGTLVVGGDNSTQVLSLIHISEPTRQP
jgi:fibronectin-binding autotransporter adhesin